MTDIVMQFAFPGMAEDAVAGDIVDKCRAMLAEEPLARLNYELAWMRYLVHYHDLDEKSAFAVLDCYRRGAPSFRTIANRCQELMRADAKLQPGAEVMERRQRQRRQGRVR